MGKKDTKQIKKGLVALGLSGACFLSSFLGTSSGFLYVYEKYIKKDLVNTQEEIIDIDGNNKDQKPLDGTMDLTEIEKDDFDEPSIENDTNTDEQVEPSGAEEELIPDVEYDTVVLLPKGSKAYINSADLSNYYLNFFETSYNLAKIAPGYEGFATKVFVSCTNQLPINNIYCGKNSFNAGVVGEVQKVYQTFTYKDGIVDGNPGRVIDESVGFETDEDGVPFMMPYATIISSHRLSSSLTPEQQKDLYIGNLDLQDVVNNIFIGKGFTREDLIECGCVPAETATATYNDTNGEEHTLKLDPDRAKMTR